MRTRWLLALCFVAGPWTLPGCTDAGSSPAADPVEDGHAAAEAAREIGPPRRAWGPDPRTSSALSVVGAHLRGDVSRSGATLSDLAGATPEAIWAAMRIGGPAALDLARRMLDGGQAGEQLAAVGLLGDVAGTDGETSLERPLWARYALAPTDEEAEAAIFSVGRVGGERSAAWLAGELSAGDGPLAGGDGAVLLEALALLCARGVQIDEAIRGVVLAELTSVEARRRAGASRATARCVASSAEQFGDEEIRSAFADALMTVTMDADSTLAALGWRGLSALGQLPDARVGDIGPLLAGDVPGHASWVARVERSRALGVSDAGRRRLMELITSTPAVPRDEREAQVLIASLAVLRSHAAELEKVDEFVRGRRAQWSIDIDPLAPPGGDARRAKIDSLVRCELDAILAVDAGDPGDFNACAGHLAGALAATLANLQVDVLGRIVASSEGKRGVDELLALARAPAPLVAAPALSALASVEHDQVNTVLREALTREDVGVLAAAAASMATRASDARLRDSAAPAALADMLRRREDVPALEARLAALDALARWTRASDGRDAAGKTSGAALGRAEAVELKPPATAAALDLSTVRALANDSNVTLRRAAQAVLVAAGEPAALEEAARTRPVPTALETVATATPAEGLRVRTDAGTVDIDLRGSAAPIQRAHLGRLAAEGFYDGLKWHRVVPGFVVQGGDPRGDGYGGPGYLVPCELSSRRFVRGAVGIATAGRDTGGSQLFVTQADTPHLDGRYTLVGYVDPEDLAVVDRVLPEDRMISVRPIARWDQRDP